MFPQITRYEEAFIIANAIYQVTVKVRGRGFHGPSAGRPVGSIVRQVGCINGADPRALGAKFDNGSPGTPIMFKRLLFMLIFVHDRELSRYRWGKPLFFYHPIQYLFCSSYRGLEIATRT
jgi:hypothetical protein